MNGKRFFLHSGFGRIAEICFITIGLVLLFALGHVAVKGVEAREAIVGIQEMIRGEEPATSMTAESTDNAYQLTVYEQEAITADARKVTEQSIIDNSDGPDNESPVPDSDPLVSKGKQKHAQRDVTSSLPSGAPDVARRSSKKL